MAWNKQQPPGTNWQKKPGGGKGGGYVDSDYVDDDYVEDKEEITKEQPVVTPWDKQDST
jgi:hypothetical protein